MTGPDRRVTVVSPHYDDVPLSLGQSLRDGALAACDVTVRVAFGRSNWTTWVHPTPGRARAVRWWRFAEETVASRAFGYRLRVAGWPEAILRRGRLDPTLLDPAADLAGEPLVDELAAWLRLVVASSDRPELLLVPAGLGGHVDHRIVALAAVRLVGCGTPVGFYEDRPYVAHLDASERDAQLAALGLDLEVADASHRVGASTQRRVRRCYPSQMDRYFLGAMELDLRHGARERVWFPVGGRPPWWRVRSG